MCPDAKHCEKDASTAVKRMVDIMFLIMIISINILKTKFIVPALHVHPRPAIKATAEVEVVIIQNPSIILTVI
jgi:hypothetical protein